jgi:hypothetical protein
LSREQLSREIFPASQPIKTVASSAPRAAKRKAERFRLDAFVFFSSVVFSQREISFFMCLGTPVS